MISLAQTIKDIKNTVQKINPFSAKGVAEGQSVRIGSNGHVTTGENLRVVTAAGNAAEANAMGTTPISLKDMFSTWQRISCLSNGTEQNATSEAQTKARNAYAYDAANNIVNCLENSDPFSAFISSDKYKPDYSITYRLKGRDGDDDGLCFIAGYMTDANGKFHALTIWRMGDSETAAADPITDFNAASHGARFAICYDGFAAWMNQAKNSIILARTLAPHKTSWNSGDTCLCEVTKTANKITAKTSDVNTTDMKYALEWTLPATKPADWSQEAYDNIKYMMQNPSNIGFGTHSNACAFAIQKQTGAISDVTVYNIDTGKKMVFRDGAKQSEVSDEEVFSPGSFIYSVSTKKLFYVRSRGNVIPIVFS